MNAREDNVFELPKENKYVICGNHIPDIAHIGGELVMLCTP